MVPHCRFIVALLPLCLQWVSPRDLKPVTVKLWAQRIADRLSKLSVKYSGIKQITESYRNLNLKVHHYSGHELSEQLSAKFERFFDEKVSALRNLAEAATALEMDYERRTRGRQNEEDDLEYHNGKRLTNLNLTMDPHFRTGINLNSSIVHVPTEGMLSFFITYFDSKSLNIQNCEFLTMKTLYKNTFQRQSL